MGKPLGEKPYIHDDCTIVEATCGRFVEIGKGSRIARSDMGDYSYCERYADIANAAIGKFANIASFVRIGPTDHPMDRASLHHFMYRSSDYWPGVEDDEAFFAHRASRRVEIGHDVWIGHGAVIRPEVTIGHGAVVGTMAVVTKDVAPYTIVTGVPATPIRRRHHPEIADRLIALAWWNWDHDRIGAAVHDFRSLSAEAFLDRYE